MEKGVDINLGLKFDVGFYGVGVNFCLKNEESFEYVICRNGYDSILEFLFKNRLDINLIRKNGEIFFYVVCEFGY